MAMSITLKTIYYSASFIKSSLSKQVCTRDTHLLAVEGRQFVHALAFLNEVAMVVQCGQKVSKVWHLQIHLLDKLLHLIHTEG